MSSHRVRAALLAGALCVLATGCGGDDGDGKSSASPSDNWADSVSLDVSTGDLAPGKSATLQVTTENSSRSITNVPLELSFKTVGLALPQESALKVEYRDGEKKPWKRLALSARDGSLRGTLPVNVPHGTVQRFWRVTPDFGAGAAFQTLKVSGSLGGKGQKVDSTWEQPLPTATVQPGGKGGTAAPLSRSAWSEYSFRVRNLLSGPLEDAQARAELSCADKEGNDDKPCDVADGVPGYAAQYFDGDGWKPLDVSKSSGANPKDIVLLREAATLPAKGEKEYRFRLKATSPLGKHFDHAELGLWMVYPKAEKGQNGVLGYESTAIRLDAN
ncbi:hypothetical protein [Streptomyces evansiae]|uniref:hypothetical protein n=1 Tax=Streptomyces evansiae TaxID=3075535 RepID=UPI002886E34E|nr:hypothetical protein [Streptomyces sp. DSM 41859]MDT0424562.1 hypothetical protein [Streptomyces sp. DSM 41859]